MWSENDFASYYSFSATYDFLEFCIHWDILADCDEKRYVEFN